MYPLYSIDTLNDLSKSEIWAICKQLGIPGLTWRSLRSVMIEQILERQSEKVEETPQIETSLDLDREAIAFVASRDTGNTYTADDIEGMKLVENGFLNIYIKDGGMVPIHRENFSLILSYRTQAEAELEIYLETQVCDCGCAEEPVSQAITYKADCCVGSDDAANSRPAQTIQKATESRIEFYLLPRADQITCLSYGLNGKHNRYIITSFRSGEYSCTCPDHQYRRRYCKHIKAYLLAPYTTEREPVTVSDSDLGKAVYVGEKFVGHIYSIQENVGWTSLPLRRYYPTSFEAANAIADKWFSEATKFQRLNDLLAGV